MPNYKAIVALLLVFRLLLNIWIIFNLSYMNIFLFLGNPILAYFFYYFNKKNFSENKHHFLLFALILDILLPFFILIALVIFQILFKVTKKMHTEQENDLYAVLKDDPEFLSYLRRKKIETENADNSLDDIVFQKLQIEPFIDSLSGNNTTLKLSIIEKLSSTPTMQSIRLLKFALDDSVYEVQYFANNSLNKIEKEIMNEIAAVTEKLKKDQNNFKLYNERAYHYLNINYLDLVDKDGHDYFFQLALHDYIYSLQLNADQDDVKFKIITAHFRTKNYKEALNSINNINLKNNFYKNKLLFYKAEALFYLKDFDSVIKTCMQIKSNGKNEDQLINKFVEQWTCFE